MSYCRMINGSDIYLYGDMFYNGICCMGCCLENKKHTNVILYTYSNAIEHMKEHQRQGDRAPYARVIKLLREEWAENGNLIDYSKLIADADAYYKYYFYINKPQTSQFRWN